LQNIEIRFKRTRKIYKLVLGASLKINKQTCFTNTTRKAGKSQKHVVKNIINVFMMLNLFLRSFNSFCL